MWRNIVANCIRRKTRIDTRFKFFDQAYKALSGCKDGIEMVEMKKKFVSTVADQYFIIIILNSGKNAEKEANLYSRNMEKINDYLGMVNEGDQDLNADIDVDAFCIILIILQY